MSEGRRRLGKTLSETEYAEIYRSQTKFYALGGVVSQGSMHLQINDVDLALDIGPDYDRLTRILQGLEPPVSNVYYNVHGPKPAAIIRGTLGGEIFFAKSAVDQWNSAGLTGARFEEVEIVAPNPSGERFFRLVVLGRSGEGLDISPRLFCDDGSLVKLSDYLWDAQTWSGHDLFTVGESHRVWGIERARRAIKGRTEWREIRIVGTPSQRDAFPIGMSEAFELNLD